MVIVLLHDRAQRLFLLGNPLALIGGKLLPRRAELALFQRGQDGGGLVARLDQLALAKILFREVE